ncbi:RDD family protein [Mycoplasmopsis bovirhinis]|uniref:RDD family protein n=1 Tax=Mycoplasmopsis bovirhinis TaxID=29553 RepID=A0A449ACB7_9BACT|nr:RDD family protein [Mycoplasmopsis bovirhinis]VEU62419.1 RDD family protein [Mycoplasmopsis bovirhinis]
MHKNSGFFKRFLANIIDLTLFTSLILLLFYFLTFSKKAPFLPSQGVFYFGVIFILISIMLIYLLIPIVFKGKTIGLWLLKLKIIDTKTKSFKYVLVIKRNYFLSFYFGIVVILILSFLSPQSFVINNKNQIALKDDLYHQIILRIITMLLSINFLLVLAGYFMLLVSKRNLTLIDLLTETRIVEDKKLQQLISEIKFLPQKNTRRKFVYK